MMRYPTLLTVSLLLGLGACDSITPTPDYAIKVSPTADGGYAAVPPQCPRPADNDLNFFDNQPLPQFGCANARNLALEIERPEDLIKGRESGPASGVTTSGSILRYYNNQTRGLLYLSPQPDTSVDVTSAPSASSGLTAKSPG